MPSTNHVSAVGDLGCLESGVYSTDTGRTRDDSDVYIVLDGKFWRVANRLERYK